MSILPLNFSVFKSKTFFLYSHFKVCYFTNNIFAFNLNAKRFQYSNYLIKKINMEELERNINLNSDTLITQHNISIFRNKNSILKNEHL